MRDSTTSRKKHDTAPVAEAAELAHGLLGEDDAKPLSETRADWIEVLADTPAPDSRHIFSPAVGNLVCERIAAGETLNKIASEPGMPSRSTIDRWCTDRPEFKRQYDIAVQLRADGLLEETIEIIDDKKEIVTETTTEDEDGTKRVSKAFTKEGLAYAMARINIRYKTLAKMAPRKWGDEGHGLGEPSSDGSAAIEPPAEALGRRGGTRSLELQRRVATPDEGSAHFERHWRFADSSSAAGPCKNREHSEISRPQNKG